MAVQQSTDRRRLRGQKTRQAILLHAARVGSAEGLEAISVPRGAGRVLALCNAWLSYVERGVFPGGCFFEAVAAEFDSRRPGPVRDSALEKKNYWSYSLERAVREAQQAGDIDPEVDSDQLAWELDSLLGGANSGFKGGDGVKAIERGRRAIHDRLSRASVGVAAHQHHGGGPQKTAADQQDPHRPRDERELDQGAEDAHGGRGAGSVPAGARAGQRDGHSGADRKSVV